jgi:hypothetical protein
MRRNILFGKSLKKEVNADAGMDKQRGIVTLSAPVGIDMASLRGASILGKRT